MSAEICEFNMNHAVKDINRAREKDAPIAGIPTYAFLLHCGYESLIRFTHFPRSTEIINMLDEETTGPVADESEGVDNDEEQQNNEQHVRINQL